VSTHTQTARAKKEAPPESATDKVLAEEADMMRHITQKQALRAAKELATDTVYTRSMSTGWKPPAEAREWGWTCACGVVWWCVDTGVATEGCKGIKSKQG
jgi:hypothetical protein